MTAGDGQRLPVLVTGRLLLRPWRVEEAVVLHELWTERDPRVPPHRRIDDDGHPTAAELADSIRSGSSTSTELAFELLRRQWGRGYATEASVAVMDWARACGHKRLWATVWDWNTASRRVLARLGFVETGRRELHPGGATTLLTVRDL